MNTIINVECVDQDLFITNSPTLASGGICENIVSFKFCNKWDGFSKTAVFYQNEKNVFYALINNQNECEIPYEVTLNEGTLYMGVFGVNGDTRRTSKIDKIRIHKGAWTSDMHPSDPTPDIYTQLMSAITVVNDLLQSLLDGSSTTPVGNAKTLEGHGASYFATAQSVTDIENGTTPVGNAKALEGHGASYFATAQSVTDIESGATQAGNAKKLNGLTEVEVGASGARNLIPYPYYETSKVSKGVTITDNGDGTITCSGVTTDNYGHIYLAKDKHFRLPKGVYTASLNADGNKNVALQLFYYDESGATVKIGSCYTSLTFELPIDAYMYIHTVYKIPDGTPYTIYPMLEVGRIAHDYIPYHFGGAEDADKVNGFKVYKSLSELGLTEATVTVESIVNAMADNSMLLHKLGGTATSAPIQFPYNYSTLKVTKLSSSYVVFECIGTGNLPIYYAYYNGGSTNKWSGWGTQCLPLTGGKLTNIITIERTNHSNVILKNNTFKRDGTKPSEVLYTNIHSHDADGNNIGSIQNYVSTTGNVYTAMLAYRNNAEKSYCQLGVKASYDGILQPYYSENGGTQHGLLHTGNSQKVTITDSKDDVPDVMEGLWAY